MGKDKKLPEGLVTRTYRFAIISVVTFALTGVAGALLGRALDKALGTSPAGTVVLLGIFYVISWFVILRLRKNLVAEIRQKQKSIETNT